MNTKICKNCDKLCWIFIIKEKCKNVVTDSISNRLVHTSEKVFFHDANNQWKCKKDRYEGFINYVPQENMFSGIEVDRDCPYYIEHTLMELNK